ncbi:unnamed protein product [Toxocara canis]|uniref:Protein kinase domain-containing protein n=1 Tax=Toxocara canis TaxID=6265 RepID=A0A183VES5_TOXCA|nr:unnamed protein product [Toxocara canis]
MTHNKPSSVKKDSSTNDRKSLIGSPTRNRNIADSPSEAFMLHAASKTFIGQSLLRGTIGACNVTLLRIAEPQRVALSRKKKHRVATEMDELERLSLVSKVCVELENHFNMGDKDVAEFIIHLATEHPTFDKFKKAIHREGLGDQVLLFIREGLDDQVLLFIREGLGDQFDDSLLANLLRLIQHMQPKKKDIDKHIRTIADDKELLKAQLPALAMANTNTDLLMEQLEGLIPKWKKDQVGRLICVKRMR